MTTVRSRKAKGRRLQNWVRDTLLSVFTSLDNNDVSCAIMGETGEDIKLSNPAKKLIPYLKVFMILYLKHKVMQRQQMCLLL